MDVEGVGMVNALLGVEDLGMEFGGCLRRGDGDDGVGVCWMETCVGGKGSSTL